MAVIIKHVSSSSCNLFVAATVVLCLVMAFPMISSAPTTDCSSNAPTDPSTQEHVMQVLGGLEILIGLGSRLNGTILEIQDFQSVNISLQMLCNMYNLYAHFTTLHMFSTVLPQSGPRIHYSSSQFVAWRVMHSACLWATSSGGSLPIDCTFHSIASACYSFSHRRLIFEDRLEVGCVARYRVPISTDQWIIKNDLPRSVADYINNIM